MCPHYIGDIQNEKWSKPSARHPQRSENPAVAAGSSAGRSQTLGAGRVLRREKRARFESARQLARDLFAALDTPVSLAQSIRLSQSEYLDLVSASVDPNGYTSADEFAKDYLACEAFSKFPSWETGVNLSSVALQRFLDSERQCLETNRRLAKAAEPDLKRPDSVASVMFVARQKISWLLGDFNWSEAEPFFDFGPGATFALSRRRRHAYYKFSGIPEATRQCAVAGEALVKSIRGWSFHLACVTGAQSAGDSLINIAPGNRITTVPKNAKTDRVIAIEPLLNGMLQKGIGGVIRRCLRRVGVDLNDQTLNQRLAREGSISGEFATIDLASASDSVASQLVRILLPPSWVSAIELCRSPSGVLPDGSLIHYQKVSSMGNGFTFELESLIFWALCSSVISLQKTKERRLRVYGDDLVVPSECFTRIVEILEYCGFTCNTKKTFAHGPFRESCGKHYFLGTDVTPFYFRKEVSVESLLLWCNNIRRWSALSFGLDPLLQKPYEEAVLLLPHKLRRPRIPDGFGDSALIGDFDECCPRRARHGFEGWLVPVRVSMPDYLSVDGWPLLLSNLLEKEAVRSHRRFDTPRWQVDLERLIGGRKTGCIPSSASIQNVSILVPQWENVGPWLTAT